MKILEQTKNDLLKERRWDLDYHLPAERIRDFPEHVLDKVSKHANIVKDKRDPRKSPDDMFLYIDISCIDPRTGIISNPQELLGVDAPSRARKVIKTNDILISTVRPTRGAIALVPDYLDNQICSTGFAVLRAKEGVNPVYLHFILRKESTLEQFRKFSTGSSYPAILESDVEKTLIPIPNSKDQDFIARKVEDAFKDYNKSIKEAESKYQGIQETLLSALLK